MPKPTNAAITAMPKVPLSVPNCSITSGATMPSNCASMPSQTSTIMQMAKAMMEYGLIACAEMASLKVVAVRPAGAVMVIPSLSRPTFPFSPAIASHK